ncbi:hypothetical protein P7C70_g255, partial [Phenoliferia sp. Uapishka_3]
MSSLFGSDSDSESSHESVSSCPIAHDGNTPPIPGLVLLKRAIPINLQADLALAAAALFTANTNQVMLFNSPSTPNLPPFLEPLLSLLSAVLPPHLASSFINSTYPLQVIVNLYRPGEGITPHVDLPTRYGDVIVGVSLLSQTVMEFTKREGSGSRAEDEFALLLRPGDCYVFDGEARYEWVHGIPARLEDEFVNAAGEVVTVKRKTRISITLRRMKEGADIVGGGEEIIVERLES